MIKEYKCDPMYVIRKKDSGVDRCYSEVRNDYGHIMRATFYKSRKAAKYLKMEDEEVIKVAETVFVVEEVK